MERAGAYDHTCAVSAHVRCWRIVAQGISRCGVIWRIGLPGMTPGGAVINDPSGLGAQLPGDKAKRRAGWMVQGQAMTLSTISTYLYLPRFARIRLPILRMTKGHVSR